jgi:hypothetical protein
VCAQASYQLGEAEYAAGESGESWPHRLLAALQAALTWLQPLLTTANYEVGRHPTVLVTALFP